MRPSGRPRLTSRCLRSPVDAGSIPYSAVTQPRPWPASQRGTPSCTEAVQITRVSPVEISAEPSALRTNPGSIVIGRSSSAAAAAGALAAHAATRAGRSTCSTALERHLQEARAERAEGLDVAVHRKR